MVVDNLRQRCRVAPEDELHKCWGRPRKRGSPDPIIQSCVKRAKMARAGFEDCPILFGRGLAHTTRYGIRQAKEHDEAEQQ